VRVTMIIIRNKIWKNIHKL